MSNTIKRRCRIAACDRAVRFNGMCGAHAQQVALGKMPGPIRTRGVQSRIERVADHARIELTDHGGRVLGFALIDIEDITAVSAFRWCLCRARNERAYARGTRKEGYLHRFLMKPPHDAQIDHINNDGLDCRRRNMRIVTAHGNAQNRKIYGRPVPRGVSRSASKSKPWRARVHIGTRDIYGGVFATVEEAAARAAEMRREHCPFATE